MRKPKERSRILKKLSRPPGGDRAGERNQCIRHRGVVCGRSTYRSEEQDYSAPGAPRKARRPAKSTLAKVARGFASIAVGSTGPKPLANREHSTDSGTHGSVNSGHMPFISEWQYSPGLWQGLDRVFGRGFEMSVLAPFEEKHLSEIEREMADLEGRIAEQDARIIVNLLQGHDTDEAEERVENDRIVLASMKTSLRALRGKHLDD